MVNSISQNTSQSISTDAAPKTGGVRFAPSPTGRFHLGNLRTAWISFQLSQALGLPWIVRFEDIDQPRVLAGALDSQLADMRELGLTPDLSLVQSHFRSRHLSLFQLARQLGAIYPCDCSRKDVQMSLAGFASASHEGAAPVYSGECRLHPARSRKSNSGAIAWRFRMPRLDGRNDFIVARTSSIESLDGREDDFVPAYHWACAIDDFDGAYDLIVRSSDLASALPLQRAIQSWIATAEAKEPRFSRAFHTSLVTQDDGHRLEKRTQGVTLPELSASGWSTEKLIRAFEQSFEPNLGSGGLSDRFSDGAFDRDGLASEASETLKISTLLRE